LFVVDLAGTFALAIPFYLYDEGIWKTFVQETRLVSDPGGRFDWVAGAYYLDRELGLDGRQASSPDFLAARGISGLPADATFFKFGNTTRSYELAGFGELAYHVSDTLTLTGGLRYAKYDTTVDTDAGFNSNYFTMALFGLSGPATIVPNAAATRDFPSAERTSWKVSLTYEPTRNSTLYATVSTGYRTPVYNARAGSVSTVDPNDLVIPQGAESDDLTNYEVGLKGRWLDGRVTGNFAIYYIDWSNLQVQANRTSDSIQFATNVGGAVSQGLEAEIRWEPVDRLVLGLNGSLNEGKVTDLTAEEAAISGAVKGARLASPHVQGSLFGAYSYSLGGNVEGFTSFQAQYVGSFPDGFPNTPGRPSTPFALYDTTDAYTVYNMQTGLTFGAVTATLYGENLGNSRDVVFIHPEAFVYSRYAILRPRTFGLRLGYEF
jgi:outer membrane receptor protein involved in Fe transport